MSARRCLRLASSTPKVSELCEQGPTTFSGFVVVFKAGKKYDLLPPVCASLTDLEKILVVYLIVRSSVGRRLRFGDGSILKNLVLFT